MLVVGGGNTGYQIAEELAGFHQVHLSIGSRQTPLPQRVLGRDLFRYLDGTGLMAKNVESRLGRRLQARETLIGSSPRAARRQGIELHGRTVDVTASEVTFGDGARLAPGPSSGRPGSSSITPGSTRRASTTAAASCTGAA